MRHVCWGHRKHRLIGSCQWKCDAGSGREAAIEAGQAIALLLEASIGGRIVTMGEDRQGSSPLIITNSFSRPSEAPPSTVVRPVPATMLSWLISAVPRPPGLHWRAHAIMVPLSAPAAKRATIVVANVWGSSKQCRFGIKLWTNSC